MVDLLSEHAAHHRASVLESDGSMVGDRREQLTVVARERGVAVADELADLTSPPAQRQPLGVRAGAALGPRDLAVLEDDRKSTRLNSSHVRISYAVFCLK